MGKVGGFERSDASADSHSVGHRYPLFTKPAGDRQTAVGGKESFVRLSKRVFVQILLINAPEGPLAYRGRETGHPDSSDVASLAD